MTANNLVKLVCGRGAVPRSPPLIGQSLNVARRNGDHAFFVPSLVGERPVESVDDCTDKQEMNQRFADQFFWFFEQYLSLKKVTALICYSDSEHDVTSVPD